MRRRELYYPTHLAALYQFAPMCAALCRGVQRLRHGAASPRPPCVRLVPRCAALPAVCSQRPTESSRRHRDMPVQGYRTCVHPTCSRLLNMCVHPTCVCYYTCVCPTCARLPYACARLKAIPYVCAPDVCHRAPFCARRVPQEPRVFEPPGPHATTRGGCEELIDLFRVLAKSSKHIKPQILLLPNIHNILNPKSSSTPFPHNSPSHHPSSRLPS